MLVPTERASFYPYEMRFSLHGRRRAIRGLVCAVELEDWGGSIVPHERTMPGPIEDRLRLMRAVRTNLSSIHAVFRGPSEPFAAFLDDAMTHGPAATTSDEAGVEHTLWVTEPNPEVATWLAPESLMIADGHHRYSMALRYRDEMRAEHGPGPWDRVMMFIADAAVQEPPVLPFHRIQTGGPHEPSGTRVRDLAEVLETVSDEKLVYGSAALEDGLLVHRIAEVPGTPPTVCALHERVAGRRRRAAPVHARRRGGRGRRSEPGGRRRVLPAADRRREDPRRDRPRRTAPAQVDVLLAQAAHGPRDPAARPRRARLTRDLSPAPRPARAS